MSDEELIEKLSTLFSKEIETKQYNQRYTDTIYNEVVKNKNIIEELEKWAKENSVNDRDIYGYETEDKKLYLDDFLDKLKELKEGK